MTPLQIDPAHWELVKQILARHVPGRRVLVFGSRTRGTARPTSDLDLALDGDGPVPFDIMGALRDDLSDSDLPFRVDVVDLALAEESFRQMIKRDSVDATTT